MIQVGIVGLGFMGMIHYLTYRKLPGVRVAAICEVNERRLTGDWTDIKGNFGPAGEQMDLVGRGDVHAARRDAGDAGAGPRRRDAAAGDARRCDGRGAGGGQARVLREADVAAARRSASG